MTRKNKLVFTAGVAVGIAVWWVASNSEFHVQWRRKP